MSSFNLYVGHSCEIYSATTLIYASDGALWWASRGYVD